MTQNITSLDEIKQRMDKTLDETKDDYFIQNRLSECDLFLLQLRGKNFKN